MRVSYHNEKAAQSVPAGEADLETEVNMASETNQKNPERSLERRKEEAHLKETLEVVRSNVETYGAEVFTNEGRHR